MTFVPRISSCAQDLLVESGLTGRVARCVIVASGGSLESLANCIGVAKSDYRDAIIAGEYDPEHCRIRDLRVSFLINEPEKMWISEVACTMASRIHALVA